MGHSCEQKCLKMDTVIIYATLLAVTWRKSLLWMTWGNTSFTICSHKFLPFHAIPKTALKTFLDIWKGLNLFIEYFPMELLILGSTYDKPQEQILNLPILCLKWTPYFDFAAPVLRPYLLEVSVKFKPLKFYVIGMKWASTVRLNKAQF